MLGTGKTVPFVLSEISNNCLNNKFIIVNANNEIYNYYNAFDLFILPSKFEGLGIVLIEAQYNGLTCLASNTIPNEACISDSYISLPLNVDRWVECIKKIVIAKKRTNKLSSSASNYDIKKSCKSLIDIYLNSNGVDYE